MLYLYGFLVSEELSIGEGEFLGFYLEEGKVTLKKVR